MGPIIPDPAAGVSTGPHGAARPGRLSLRRALASYLTAFAVLPAVVGGLLIALGGGWLIQAEVFAHMQSLADGGCQELQAICNDELSDLDRFAQRPSFRQAAAVLADPNTRPAEREAQQELLVLHLGQLTLRTEHLGGAAVVVSLRTGRAVAWGGCSESHARVIVAEHAPHAALAATKPWLSEAHPDRVTGTPVIAAMQALPLPEGRSGPPVAAVIVHVPLAFRVYPAIHERSKIGRTGEIVFVDKNGLALHDLRYEPGSAFRKVIRAAPAQAAAAGARWIRVSRDYRGVPVVAAVGHVPATGWGIVVKQDAAEAYGPAVWLAAIWLVLMGLLVPVAVRSARRLSARFLQPVEELALATHRIASGDLDTPAPEHRDDELGALVSDFNRMAVQIAASEEALRQQRDRLEELVAERTAELELQARALSASNKELEAFSYSVSHDLRAPLRAIDGFSQALLEDYADALDEQGRHYVDRVRGATQRMGELIDDLLTLSRVTRDPMRWEDVDLSAIAHEIVADLQVAEPHRQVAVVTQEGLAAHGHPALLRALLLNLLGNAWKFTSRRAAAQIEFGAAEQNGETAYFVRDNGAGFDMRYVDKLFAPFQRLHAQEEFPGNGVGLATVQRVVNRHGGRAWAEGAVDQGATFYFTIGD